MINCIFCGIVEKKQSTDFLFENSEIVAMKDIKPAAPVHILILPKEHVESIMKAEEKHRDMVSRLIFTAKDLAKKMELTGYKLIFNVGKDGGQVISHLHLHLLGGWNSKESMNSIPHLA